MLTMIFILKFSFPYKFFLSQFCLFLIFFFELQVLLNLSWIAKCHMFIQTLPTSRKALVIQNYWYFHVYCESIALFSYKPNKIIVVSEVSWLFLKFELLHAFKYAVLLLTLKNICNLIGWEEYNIGHICTLFTIFVLFD